MSANNALIGVGGTLTGVGFAGVIVGVACLVWGQIDRGDPGVTVAGAIGVGAGNALGTSGSIMLGVGIARRKDLRRTYDVGSVGEPPSPPV